VQRGRRRQLLPALRGVFVFLTQFAVEPNAGVDSAYVHR
jgi:hypothetical protein